MKFPSHFSMPSQKWQGIGGNDMGVSGIQSEEGTVMTFRHPKVYTRDKG